MSSPKNACVGGYLTLSAMKSPAYAPDLLLENCDQMVLCTANHTQTGFSI